MKTTLMTSRVDALTSVQGAGVLGLPAVLAPAAVRERCTAPVALLPHGTGLSAASDRTAVPGVSPFAPALLDALPGPPRGAPV